MDDTRSPGQNFQVSQDRNISKWFGPIIGSKWTYFGSKKGIFGPRCIKKGKMYEKDIKKWMVLGLLAQLFDPVEIEILLNGLDLF